MLILVIKPLFKGRLSSYRTAPSGVLRLLHRSTSHSLECSVMYISHPWLASAIALSIPTFAHARVAQHTLDTGARKGTAKDDSSPPWWPIKNIFKRQSEIDCSFPNSYYSILNSTGRGDKEVQYFCNRWLAIPPKIVETEITPTITITTTDRSTKLATSTTRTTITVEQTITRSSVPATESTKSSPISAVPTTTPAPIVPRAANVEARVNKIINSVLENGMATPTATPGDSIKDEDDKKLSLACSCADVEPTSTSTITSTASPVSTTTARFFLVFQTLTTTKTVTTRINVDNATPTPPIMPTGSSQSPNISTAILTPTVVAPSITLPPSIVLVSTGSIAPTAGPVGPRLPVVIGFPFSCPKSTDSSPRFIVGDFLYEYSLQCDKAIVGSTAIVPPQEVNDPTACAELCSLMNEGARSSLCQSAQFTPILGLEKGSCVLNGPANNLVDQPGSIAIVLINTSSPNAEGCDAIASKTPSSNTTSAPAAASILASISSASYSRSIPGFQTRSEAGGAFKTMFSTGYTDSLGYYYYSWYEIEASSTAWQEIYRASWSACPQSTRTPIGLPASVTGDGAIFSTGYSTATTLATGGGGVQPPSPASSVTGIATPTSASSREPDIFIRSGESTFYTSNGGFGVIPPPSRTVSSALFANSTLSPPGSDAFTLSSATSTYNFTGGARSLKSTGGEATNTGLWSSVSTNSTGGNGVYSPFTTSTPISEAGQAFTTGGAMSIFNSTGGNGGIHPTPPANISASPATSGGIEFTISGQSSAFFSTGGFGSQGPIPGTANSSLPLPTAPSSELPSNNSTVSFPASATSGSSGLLNSSLPGGSAAFSTGGAFSTFFSTGGNGVIPPRPTNASQSVVPSQTPSLNPNETALLSSGTGAFTTAGSFSIASSTGGSGGTPPSLSNVSETASASFPASSLNNTSIIGTGALTISSSASIILSTGGFGVIPPAPSNASGTAPSIHSTPSANTTLPSATGTASTEGDVAILSTTGSSGIIPPPSQNTTTSPQASITPSPSFNASVPIDTDLTTASATSVPEEDEGGFSAVSEGVPPSSETSENATTTVGSSSLPTLSVNASTSLVATGPITSSSGNFTISGSTAVSFSTGASGVISPVMNLTTALPSLTPSPSGNVSSSTDTEGSISDKPRTPNTRNSTVVPIGTAPSTGFTALANSTTTTMVLPSSSKPQWGGYGPPPQVTPTTTVQITTSLPGTLQLSMSTPPLSANSSLPIINSTSLGTHSEDEDDRRRKSKSSTPSAQFPTLTANTTIPFGTGSGSTPTSTINPTASDFLPPPSFNSSGLLPTGTAPLTTPLLSVNSSSVLPTGSISATLPPVSFNFSLTGSTGLVSSAVPTESLSIWSNSSMPLGTGTTAIPVSLNETSFPGTSYVPVPSLTPSPSLNSSLSTGTSPSSLTPIITANSSLPTVSGTGAFPMESGNSTGLLPTGTTSTNFLAPLSNTSSYFPTYTPISPPPSSGIIPSSANTTSPPGTSEACPTASFSVVERVSIITTTYYETVPVGPSTCLPTASASLPIAALNATSSTSLVLPSSGVSLPWSPRFRRSGEIATPEQIEAACKDSVNLVLNPNFALDDTDETSALEWTTVSDDPSIAFRHVTSKPPAVTPSFARVLATTAGPYLTASQPLTLCPGRQYTLSSFNKQANLLNRCTVEYLIGNDLVASASPQEVFLKKEEFFTAGATPEAVSQDLRIRAKCVGSSGGGNAPMEVNFREVKVALVV
ncbi:unnamed protein product [Periconia digitata]|uniref:Uncharacterized protein n=1 Tax=Periconia digitata TaxID=1303443 RepID=A0A9W4XNT6_9PLEO|nr:unnamed protein product [Periconia digitata]